MIVGNSFGYFDNPNDDVRILREVFRVLKPYGKVLLDLADGDYFQKITKRCPGNG
jgi:D-alanine-D-alanine ligase